MGYERYALLGWSDGGITALMMAAAFPQQVSELVVWGGNAFINEEDINILKSKCNECLLQLEYASINKLVSCSSAGLGLALANRNAKS